MMGMKMIKSSLAAGLLWVFSNGVLAITPTFVVVREINFGLVLPSPGSCRMIASTGAITSYVGQNICYLPDNSQNGRYTIMANPNKIIRVKVLPDQDTGDGVVFNPYIELIVEGVPGVVISNNVGYKSINTGATGIVELFLGGDLTVSGAYAYGQTVTFSFLDAIDWYEEP
jgi:hypothetical protein